MKTYGYIVPKEKVMIILDIVSLLFQLVFVLVVLFWAKEIFKLLLSIVVLCYTTIAELANTIMLPITTRLSKSGIISRQELRELMEAAQANLILVAERLDDEAQKRLLEMEFPITRNGFMELNKAVRRELVASQADFHFNKEKLELYRSEEDFYPA